MSIPLVKPFTYVGTGLPIRVRIGFQADVVWPLKGDNATPYAMWKHKWNWQNSTPYAGDNVAHIDNTAITGFTGDEIVIGTDASVNAAGVTYYGLAIADNGSGLVKCLSRYGDGVAGSAVTDPGLMPVFVFYKRDSTFVGEVRAAGMSNSFPADNTTAGDRITSLTASGFTLSSDTDVNVAVAAPGDPGEGCDYFCLGESAYWRVIQYQGTGADDLAISFGFDLGASPAAIMIKSHHVAAPRFMHFKTSDMTTTNSISFGNAAGIATGIKSMSATGMVLGTSVNVNVASTTYTAIIFRDTSALATRINTRPRVASVRNASQVYAAAGGVYCGGDSSLNLAGSALSLEWYCSILPMTVDQWLIGRVESATNAQYAVYVESTDQTLKFATRPTGGQQDWLTGIVPPFGRMWHGVLTFNGTDTFRVFIDGEIVKSMKVTSGITIIETGTPRFAFGARRTVADALTDSAIGSRFALARVYNTALTDAQVAARYVSVCQGGSDSVSFLEEWKPSNLSGSTWVATTSTNNNGTLATGTNIVSVQ